MKKLFTILLFTIALTFSLQSCKKQEVLVECQECGLYNSNATGAFRFGEDIIDTSWVDSNTLITSIKLVKIDTTYFIEFDLSGISSLFPSSSKFGGFYDTTSKIFWMNHDYYIIEGVAEFGFCGNLDFSTENRVFGDIEICLHPAITIILSANLKLEGTKQE